MKKELRSIEVFAEDYERYMAICERYDTITPTNFLGIQFCCVRDLRFRVLF